MKTISLLCAAILSFSAGGLGMHHAGWFQQRNPRSDAPQVRNADPMSSDAAMRYRQCQQNNWRLVMHIR